MSIEVFVFGASNGAFSVPSTDSSYFEHTYYSDIDGLPKNTPLFDVRLRQKGEERYVDYTFLLYGLKGSRSNDYVGITCRSSLAFKRLGKIYDLLQFGVTSYVIDTLVNSNCDTLIGDIRKADEVRNRFVKFIESLVADKSISGTDFVSIPSRPKSSSGRLIKINPSDINLHKTYVETLVDGSRILISNEFTPKKLGEVQNELVTQVRDYKTKLEAERSKATLELQNKLASQKQTLVSDFEVRLKEERERVQLQYQQLLDLQKSSAESKLQTDSSQEDASTSKYVSQEKPSQDNAQSSKAKRDERVEGGRETPTKGSFFHRLGSAFCKFKNWLGVFIVFSLIFNLLLLLGGPFYLWQNSSFVADKQGQEYAEVSDTDSIMDSEGSPESDSEGLGVDSQDKLEGKEEALNNSASRSLDELFLISIEGLKSGDQSLSTNKEYTFSIKGKSGGEVKTDSIQSCKWRFSDGAKRQVLEGRSVKNSFESAASGKKVQIECEVALSEGGIGKVIREISIE